MIRVLHIMGCADAGGISSVVLNFYRFLDRSEIQFDIGLTVRPVGQNARALEELGARIFFLPLKGEGLSAFREALAELLRTEHYDAIHVHESETSYVALQVAKQAGIPVRIAHSHTSSPWEGVRGEVRRLSGCLLNYHFATHVIGCGKLAGERVFGKWNMRRPKAQVIYNGIDSERFAFDPALRRQVRQELGVENCHVIGMVGRLSEEKNPGYLVERMPQILLQRPDAVLVMAGNGPEEEKIRTRIRELGLKDKVKLLGRRSDVERLYQAFDVFALPSFTEGFPVAAVEAMASGLPVLMSDVVTRELAFYSEARYLSLKDEAGWCRAAAGHSPDGDRVSRGREVAQNGLDIRTTARALERIYRG